MKFNLLGMTGILFSVAGACALVQSAQAAVPSFTDTNRDLILTFRKTGFDGVGSVGTVVFEVDIGQSSIYYGAAAGTSIPITAYSATAQLGTLFDSLSDMSWSVAGCVPNAGDNGSASKPTRTLWLTDPRSNPGTPAAPWLQQSTFTQGQPDSHIVAILNNALTWAQANSRDSVTNTPTALAIPAGNGDNAGGSLGALGNFLGTFGGNGSQSDVENTTDSTFGLGGEVSRSDFYELQPGSGAGTYLGYFEFDSNGSMTFYAQQQAVVYPSPTLGVGADGNGNALISFQSTANGTYSLHYTNQAGLTAPVSQWPTVGTNIIGNGSIQTFTRPTSGAGTFYGVSVH
jgi:hypothetical protein